MASQNALGLTVRVDTTDLMAAIQWAAKHTSRSHEAVVNGQLLALAKRAIKFTHKASKASIDKLNERVVVGHTLRNVSTKTGKMGRLLKKPKKIFSEAKTFAELIIIKRFRQHKQPVPKRDVIRQLADKMIAARKRSIGFIKSGWIPAIRTLINWERELRWAALLTSNSRDGAKIFGGEKGGAIPAKAGALASGTIWNEAIVPMNKFNEKDNRSGNPMFYAEQGLAIAMRATIADIHAHLKKKYDQLNRRRP